MTLVEEYLSSLKELTGNSRPQINMLTMLADDNYAIAPSIAYTIEAHIESLRAGKLYVFYLIDSIVKNVRKGYVELFARNLPTLFSKMFAESDGPVRASLYKLRSTWDGIFPKERLAWLDTLVNQIDPNWPVVRLTNIHVNPDFIRGGPNRSNIAKEDMREKILEREILELERKKVELELRHTKEVLEKEQKKLESFTMNIKGGNKPAGVTSTPVPDSSSSAADEKLPSSSLKHIESENTKKLIEVSSRDPRRKARQAEIATPSSPGAASPNPDAIMSGSEDGRDRPYRKKNDPKEKKRSRDKERNREERHSKRPYKVKSSTLGVIAKSKDNGQAFKKAVVQKNLVDMVSLFGEKGLPQERSLSEDVLPCRLTADAGTPVRKIHPGQKSEPISKSLLPLPNEVHAMHLEKDNPKTHPPEDYSDSSVIPSLNPVDSSISPVKPQYPRTVVESPRAESCPSVTDNTVVSAADKEEDDTSSNREAFQEEMSRVLDPFSLNKLDVSLKAIPGSSSDVKDTCTAMVLDTDLNSENSFNAFKDKGKLDNVDDSSVGTVSSELSGLKCSEPLITEERGVAQMDDDFDPSSPPPSNKRKLDLEENNDEVLKKRLLSDLIVGEGGSPMSVGSATELSAPADEGDRVVSPPSAPPPPSIPPLVDNAEDLSEKETEASKPVTDRVVPSSPALAASEESGKDVDLRLLLPRPVERVQEEIKIGNAELDPLTLFGGEDVDYRQKPLPTADFNMPSPPPPPVISNLQEPVSKKSWAQIKDRKSEERTPKTKPDRTKRSSITQGRPSPSSKGVSRQDSETHCNILIKDAEEQLRNGNISFVEYNRMLQEVVSINEERILKEAKASYSNNSFSQDEPRLKSPCGESEEMSLEEKDDDLADRREQPRVGEPINMAARPELAVDARPLPLEPPLLSEEPYRRERFDFPDRRIVSDMRDRQPPPIAAAPNVVDSFPRARPQMQPCPPFVPPNIPFQMDFRPRMPRNIPPTLLPQADMDLLLEADRERLDTISIGGQVRQVRFYGTTAVVLLSWDNPREVRFPVDQRSLFVDKRHEFVLGFGDPPTEITIDGMSSLVQLGAPTREIYIDNKFLSVQFGGRPIEVLMCGRVRSICLSGPPPIVRFGPVKRTDLVAGSVTLYVNAKSNFQFHLDAKPQKFHIEGEACVLQFADNLLTVLINGVPVPLEFGGFPIPVMFRGIMHFLRLTCLPYGIVPGQVSILNMETFAQPPSPVMMPLPMAPPVVESNPLPPPPQMFLPTQVPPAPAPLLPIGVQRPVDVLASMMNPPGMALSSSDNSYSVEPPAAPMEEDPPPETSVPVQETPNLNINDLFQKLIQTGILHGTAPAPVVRLPDVKAPPEAEADFYKPETLKLARPTLVTKLYSGIQCSSCGIRFPPEGTKMYSRHLDWHFRQNKREKHSTKKPQCRGWYYDLSNWMQYQELEDPDENDPEHLTQDKEDEVEEDMPCVPVGHLKDVVCRVCRERFEEFFDHETEDWQARNALHVEDSFYHPLCYEEFKKKPEQDDDPALPEDEDERPPSEDRSIEYIDLDDTEVPSPVPSPDGESLPLLGPAESPDVIAIDDVSDDKSEPEVKDEDAPPDYTSADDDILDIIPIERKIESVELLDDDDEEKPPATDNGVDLNADNETSRGGNTEEEEFDFTTVRVKVEKDRVNPDNVDSSLPTYTATIDGNIVHETAAPLVIPHRIKINIHRMAKQSESDNLVDSGSESNDMLTLSQPPPPGEETAEPPAASLKTKLVGVELSQQPPLDQGVECSGLCSIM